MNTEQTMMGERSNNRPVRMRRVTMDEFVEFGQIELEEETLGNN